jgi:predicted permease
LLIRSWPSAFRRRLGEEMVSAFTEAWGPARARGLLAAACLLARTTVDLVVSGLAEHVAPSFAKPDHNGGSSFMDSLRLDVRFALRSLLRRPTFTLVAVSTLALGVGANSAIFSVVNGVLLRPLPWAEQDRLIRIWTAYQDAPDVLGSMSRPDLLDVEATDAFEVVAGYTGGTEAFTGFGEAEAITTVRVTSGLLRVFGVSPLLGRDLTLADAESGAHEVVVLSHQFWVDRLGGDPNVIGSSVELGGKLHRVVGVAPPGFTYPAGSQLWMPYENPVEECGRGCHTLVAIGRLAPDVSLEEARAQVDALAANLRAAFPDSNFEKLIPLRTLEETTVGSVRKGIWLMLGAVGLVLLIACANVANLMLARALARSGEVAVRSALGASSRRLASQVLVESLLLAAAGSGLGLLLAFAGTALLRRIPTGTVPRINEVSVDGTVLAFTAAVSVLVALLFGLAPALRAARTSPAANLTASGRNASGTRADARSRSLLLAMEVALSVMLLAGAGLLLKSFARLYAIDPGYETEHIVRFSLTLPEARYPELEPIVSFYRQLEERIAAEPGVEAVGSAFGPPLGRGDLFGDVRVEGRPEPASEEGTSAAIRPVTAGFFDAMRIPAVRGRLMNAPDGAGPEPVALVNERFVREHFPVGEVLGQRVRVMANFGFGSPTWTIVGVVPDVRSRSLTAPPPAEIYVPHALLGPNSLTVSVRTAAGAPDPMPAIRQAVRALDAAVPVRAVETVADAVARQFAPTRFFLSLVAAFALLALVLAATGLYGVATFLASRRRREVGIRIALGAPRPQVVRLILQQGLRPALLGVVVGVAGSWAASRWLESLLYEVERTDPLVSVGVVTVLMPVVVLACLIPAREAARVDPVQALRVD